MTPKKAPAKHEAKAEAKPAAKAKGKRILIVEDEKPLAHALELKLSHEGYDTSVALTGEDGLKQINAGHFDLILLDLILPGLDGFSVLQAVDPKKLKCKIVVLSNLGQDEDKVRAKELGASDYLVKSNVPLTEIVALVKKMI